MTINTIEIENYKGISKLKFSPKKINIIVGKNNTGKTSILEAINLLFYNEEIQKKTMASFFNIYSKNRTITISATVNDKKIKITIREPSETEVTNAFAKKLIENFIENFQRNKKENIDKIFIKELETVVIKNLDDEFRNVLTRNSLVLSNEKGEDSVYHTLEFSMFDKLQILMRVITEQMERLLPTQEKTEQSKHLRNAAERTIFSPSFVSGFASSAGRLNRKLIQQSYNSNVIYIRSIIDEINISFSRRRPEDSERLHKIEKIAKEHNFIGNLEKLDFDNVLFTTPHGIRGHAFSFLGDGFKSIIGLLWQLSSDKISNSIILLDELENHMHPGFIKELIKFIIDSSKELNVQFFITTHSSDVLEIFLSEELNEIERTYVKDELRILKMDKIKDSMTIAECLNYDQSRETKDKLLLDLRGI